ncbi:MAG: hypothetical protein ABIH46_01390 [Chloroflexota bacterium]
MRNPGLYEKRPYKPSPWVEEGLPEITQEELEQLLQQLPDDIKRLREMRSHLVRIEGFFQQREREDAQIANVVAALDALEIMELAVAEVLRGFGLSLPR